MPNAPEAPMGGRGDPCLGLGRHPWTYVDVGEFVGHYANMTMNAVPSVLSKIVPDVDTEENDGQMKLLGQQACKHLRERPGHRGSPYRERRGRGLAAGSHLR